MVDNANQSIGQGNYDNLTDSENNSTFSDNVEISTAYTCPLHKNIEMLAEKPPDVVTIYCEHRTSPLNRLDKIHIVPTIVNDYTQLGKFRGYKEKLQIVYTGEKAPPPSLTLKCDKYDIEENFPGNGGNYEVELLYPKEELDIDVNDGAKAVVQTFMEAIKGMNTYKQHADYRIIGLPTGTIDVRIYNPEAYIIEIGLTPFKAINAKARANVDSSISASYDVTNSGESGVQKSTKQVQMDAVGNIIYKSNIGNTPPITGFKSINISRDGQAIQLDAFSAINTILEVYKAIMEIVKLIKDYSPKWGFYFVFDLQILSGSLAFGWTWKEDTDNRAYYHMCLAPKIDFYKVLLEVGFGIDGYGILSASVFIKLDSKLSLIDQNDAKYYPGQGFLGLELGLELKLVNDSAITIGAQAEVKHILNVTADFSSHFIISGKWKLEPETPEGFSVNAEIKWTGITFTYTASIGPGGVFGSKKGKHTIVSPSILESFEFPKEKNYIEGRNYNTIKNNLTNEFALMLKGEELAEDIEFAKIYIVETDQNRGLLDRRDGMKRIEIESSAEKIAERLHKEPIDFDLSTNALITSIRAYLDSQEAHDEGHAMLGIGKPWKEIKDIYFDRYLKGKLFEQLVEAYKCPLLEKQTQYQKEKDNAGQGGW